MNQKHLKLSKRMSFFSDISENKRKVCDLSWALDGCKLAAAHDVSEMFAGLFSESYVWDIGI